MGRDWRGQPAPPQAQGVAYRRRHAPDSAQGMGEPGARVRSVDAREEGPRGHLGTRRGRVGVALDVPHSTFRTGEASRNAATLVEALLREQGKMGQGSGGDRDDLDMGDW